MRRKIYLYWGNDEKYEVASDATVTEEFSETLDSAAVVLPNVKGTSGIVYGAKPYDEVYLSVVLADGTTEYGEWMLIDSVDSTQTSFSGTAYFDVTLQLMSETKYLEKKQLPNVSVTHSLITGQKTLYEAIKYYLEAYPIEYTGEKSRKSLITLDATADWTIFKNARCSDVMMSKPTLRQCLTTLMSQVGCIPVVKHRELSYLNLGASHTRFVINRSTPGGSVRRSVSSDSWVNSIVAESSQCVDRESKCIIESLCFRDRENVLLKQEENLKLETRYPIYEVKKLVLNAYVRGTRRFQWKFINGGNSFFSGIGGGDKNQPYNSLPACLMVSFANSSAGGSAIKISPWCSNSTDYITASGTMNIDLTLARVDSDKGLTAIKKKTLSLAVNFSNAKQSDPSTWTAVVADAFEASDYTGNEITLATFSFDGTISVNGVAWEGTLVHPNFGFATDSFASDETIWPTPSWNLYKGYFTGVYFQTGYYDGKLVPYTFEITDATQYGFRSWADITPLCVESSKRSQLEVDYLAMPTEWAGIEEMSKWLYATVGYEMGGTSIEGFSAKYSQDHGFYKKDYTYIENIISVLNINRQGVSHFYADIIPEKYWDYMFDTQEIYNPFFASRGNFSLLFFDVEYVPLIQAKTAYDKEDVALPLEQLDSAESGVSDMDSVSRLECQKADRLGNAVYSVHARVDSYSDLPALNSAWSGRIAFKRTIKFGANAIDAEYALAEDYVIKNYFTSITTKYRAYEYVDYDQAIERRELLKAYIRLSPSDSGNAINKFPANKGILLATNVAETLVDSLEGYQGSDSMLMGAGRYDEDGGYATECELSAVATGDRCVLTMKEYDNESDGPYVDGTYLTKNGNYYDNPIGGIPQKWYEGNNGKVGWLIFHSVAKPLRSDMWGSDYDSFIGEYVRKVQKYPRYYITSLATLADYDSYWLVRPAFDKKDASELLSYSVQFEACWCPGMGQPFADKSKGRFAKWLFRFSSALGGYPSESAYLAWRNMDASETWIDSKRSLGSSDDWQKTDAFLTYDKTTVSYAVDDAAAISNTLAPIEVAIIDGEDVYPVARFARNALSSKVVYMKCVPSKSDKWLKESASRSLLYETY